MEITPQELHAKMQDAKFRSHSIVVDVRVPGEHRAERIPSTLNIPLDKLEDFKDELAGYEHVYVHCETGGRSGQACQQLKSMMLENWVNIDGGIQEWKLQNLPTITSKSMSMQRQIMVAAGSLVLIGTLLSFFKTGLIGIAIFVGVGLVFAGITNYCGMAMLLRKMPWNRK
jgi:rhodanese-related sulfurtransferase